MYKGDHTKGEIELVISSEKTNTLASDELKPLGLVYSDNFIKVHRDPVLFPDGNSGSYLRLASQKVSLDGNVGSAVIGVTDSKILLINMFRHALRARSLEIPRGFSEGDSDLSTALREVKEETGYIPDSIKLIGYVHPDSGLTSNKVALYYATLDTSNRFGLDKIEPVADQSFYELSEIKYLIQQGQITDSFTLSALTLAYVQGFLNIA